MNDWTIEEASGGTWDVLQNRRIVHYDFDDLEQATEFVRRHRDFDPTEDTVMSVTLRGVQEAVDIRGR